jgi:hypothetical protein
MEEELRENWNMHILGMWRRVEFQNQEININPHVRRGWG